MKLPNLEDYINTAQIDPSKIFKDPILQKCAIQKNALGMPRIRSGNFAIIFKLNISNLEYAVRCFLNMPETSEKRHHSIEKKINSIESSENKFSNFTKFNYQKEGILVDQNYLPIIKMKWVKGPTLGEFISREYRNEEFMLALKLSLRELYNFLKVVNCAHGDIQPGNLIVNNNGKTLKLIDYDGMYVPDIKLLGAAEIGHINFQHPKRNKTFFTANLDFFSFILLDTVITCLINNPDLWDESFSDEEGILFRAEDLRNPSSSFIFDAVEKTKNCKHLAQNFASICLDQFQNIPEPTVFYKEEYGLNNRIIFKPESRRNTTTNFHKTNSKIGPYISFNKVLNANMSADIVENIGHRVELIGIVHEVRVGKSQFGNNIKLRPYIYLDFNPMSSGKVLRVKFLPDIIENAQLSSRLLPDDRWVKKWITITEIVQPIQTINHPSFKNGLEEISIVVSNPNQIRIIAASEASYRLGEGKSNECNKITSNPEQKETSSANKNRNQDIVDFIRNL